MVNICHLYLTDRSWLGMFPWTEHLNVAQRDFHGSFPCNCKEFTAGEEGCVSWGEGKWQTNGPYGEF